MKLAGKVALVTGSSPNIGGGIAEGLADEGARLVCLDIQPENAEQCAQSIRSAGGEAIGIVCDITDEEQVKAAVARAAGACGGIDILVNNAGILGGAGVIDMPLAAWTRQITVNLTGTFLMTKYVAQQMIAQGHGGSIIVVASTAAHQGQYRNIGYSTSKAGLLNFARSAAMELAEHGIRVNSLTPTATDPGEAIERGARWGRPRAERRGGRGLDFRKHIPLGELPSPRHYARAAVFLASDDAEMITGFDLRVDAGAIAKYWPWIPGT